MLTIQNYGKIVNEAFEVGGKDWLVKSFDDLGNRYIMTLLPREGGHWVLARALHIHIYRNLNDDGYSYRIDLRTKDFAHDTGNIHCSYLRDPMRLLEWIGYEFLERC